MLKNISLKFFRKHEDLTINFTQGLNAIKGSNEIGKTTILEAWAYLCYGARALRQPLEEMVTYGQTLSKLRVEGVITHLGVEYSAYRAKSGAEVTFGKERITGQTEVTKFFEQLFGADAALAGKLMVSNQKALAESLTGGPTAAGKMIEDLAEFDLIEQVVEKIQTKLVSGVTSVAEARVAQLAAVVAAGAGEQDVAGLKQADANTSKTLLDAELVLRGFEHSRNEYDVDQAKAILADEKRLQGAIATVGTDIAAIERALAVAPPDEPAADAIEALRTKVAQEKDITRILALRTGLQMAKIVPEQWDKDLASLETEIVTTEASMTSWAGTLKLVEKSVAEHKAAGAAAAADYRLAKSKLEGRLIKETSCAFCQKDLTDVPEVVRLNSDLNTQLLKLEADLRSAAAEGLNILADLEEKLATAQKEFNEANGYLADLKDVVKAHERAETVYAGAADYITIDRSVVPGKWEWAGPTEVTDSRAELAALEQQQKVAVAAGATRAQQERQLSDLRARCDALVLERAALQIGDATETIHLVEDLDSQIAAHRPVLATAERAHQQAAAALATATALAEQAARQFEKAKVDLAGAQAELADMQANNVLIKKVKAARPVITDKLWSIVLAGTTQHFSKVRGEVSNITRADSVFKCNGQPVAGLSGSAQDMLGLAIRISLSRTFLPAADFLLLDEPAAACSDSRETAMLGLLATLGYGQIIMVSHSPLVDAFSDNVVTI